MHAICDCHPWSIPFAFAIHRTSVSGVWTSERNRVTMYFLHSTRKFPVLSIFFLWLFVRDDLIKLIKFLFICSLSGWEQRCVAKFPPAEKKERTAAWWWRRQWWWLLLLAQRKKTLQSHTLYHLPVLQFNHQLHLPFGGASPSSNGKMCIRFGFNFCAP